ncbi:MAG: TonB-dependent receptor [Acidobacteriaceae bacterium]|nr:TonB-dependent receptor [Acidobacteriaceae bacterium]
MSRRCFVSIPVFSCSLALLIAVQVCRAQFNASIQGVVTDPSGAVVPKATVTLLKEATQLTVTTTSDESGNYRFVSLGAGRYRLTAEASGFSKTMLNADLEPDQNLNVPITVTVATAATAIQVTGEAPLLNTAETRNQLTLETQALTTLPLAGRNMISLATLAPGAVGLGTTTSGSPGSGVDNYSTETQVDLSANGQGSVGNMFVVDGLDVSSAIRPGVLNLTPNPDSIAETSIQTNTYNVDYGRASSIQMIFTTKSGTDAFHGNVGDYFTNQHLFAGTEFVHNYAPFHSNNMSATVGGPIIPHHQFFFFFSIEPLWSSAAAGSVTTFEDPAFTSWAQANFPNTFGTKLLTSYKPANAVATSSQTAAQLFPGSCGTANAAFVPCSLPVLDTGVFSETNFRNGRQWSVRVDKYFKNDRIYGSWYRTTVDFGGSNVRPEFITGNNTYQRALQINETHNFSPTTLNEVQFALNRVEGITPSSGLFTVPVVNVTGMGSGFGDGFALGDFIQHNYHWRDVLTHIRGAHDLRFGYEGWFGDDVEDFQGPHAQPTFQFNNLIDLVEDRPYNETGVAYNPLTGQPVLWDWNAASQTWGLFAEDSWKIRNNLTVNYGIRWDDFGNPYSRDPLTTFSNFFYGPGQTLSQQIANGSLVEHHHALNRSITDVLSPRGGVAWDPTGKGTWSIRAGAGVFHNWPTMANVQEEYRGNPPGPIYPTFYGGTATPPLLSFGTNNTKPPFGYTYPALPAGQLNSQGGITGLQFNVGGINSNLNSPVTYNYSASAERKLGPNLVAFAGYSGTVSHSLLSAGGEQGNVNYGQDINQYAGDLIQHQSLVPTRLNTSFGQILYTTNDRVSRYDAFISQVRGRFGNRGFVTLSYTRSRSRDDTQYLPTYLNPHQYYGPSVWDAPNRLSLAWNYQIPGLNSGHGFTGRVTGGWSVSGTSILQSGYPFTVFSTAPFCLNEVPGTVLGRSSPCGDFLANGDNYSYPNVTSYKQNTSRQAWLSGTVFQPGQFTIPALGTLGNEVWGGFRAPRFAETDAALLKDTAITERVKLQLRFEFFNIFNHPNLNFFNSQNGFDQSVQADVSSSTFGKVTGQSLPRWIQIGANIVF